MPNTITPDVTTAVTTVQKDATSFFSSPTFLNHVRTWTLVVVAIFAISFLFVHESNSNAASTATASLIIQQGQQQQAAIKEQIAAVNESTTKQVAVVQQQIQHNQQQSQSVLQTLVMLKSATPPNTPALNIQPIVVPATGSTPASTTANDKAVGDLPVATISGEGLKQLTTDTLVCKQQAVELDGCKKDLVLEQKNSASLTTEVVALKKVKIEPAWKKTLKIVGWGTLTVVIAIAAHAL